MFVHLMFVHLVGLVQGALRRFAVPDVSAIVAREEMLECGRFGRGRQLELLV